MFESIYGVQEKFGSMNTIYTIYDSEFMDLFSINADDYDNNVTYFFDFLDSFYKVYIKNNKNPITNIIILMAMYSPANDLIFHKFLKSKGFELDDYGKYLALV